MAPCSGKMVYFHLLEQLKNSRFLKLSHKKTSIYTNHAEPKCGINIDDVKKLVTETKEYSNLQRIMGILSDEIKIKSGLVTQNRPGVLLGFVAWDTWIMS